jgi:hypothetical protein
MAGFCELAVGLQAPDLASSRAKSLIVSGGRLKYSRFWETRAGDGVRSALRGRACSATRPILRLGHRQIGNRAASASGGNPNASTEALLQRMLNDR